MADDDALIAKAAEALLRERRRRWGSVHQGDCITDARAVIAAVRGQIAAEALQEAADSFERRRIQNRTIYVAALDSKFDNGVPSGPATWLRNRADRLGQEEPDHG